MRRQRRRYAALLPQLTVCCFRIAPTQPFQYWPRAQCFISPRDNLILLTSVFFCIDRFCPLVPYSVECLVTPSLQFHFLACYCLRIAQFCITCFWLHHFVISAIFVIILLPRSTCAHVAGTFFAAAYEVFVFCTLQFYTLVSHVEVPTFKGLVTENVADETKA